MEGKSHVVETMVCGYHVYKEICCAAVGEELSCIREVENYRYCDPFAVAVVRLGVIVGMFDGLFFVNQNSQTLRF